MVIRYDMAQGKFINYMPMFPETSPANALIKGGESYIVIMNTTGGVQIDVILHPKPFLSNQFTVNDIFSVKYHIVPFDGTDMFQ
jgi:hypothetical protein